MRWIGKSALFSPPFWCRTPPKKKKEKRACAVPDNWSDWIHSRPSLQRERAYYRRHAHNDSTTFFVSLSSGGGAPLFPEQIGVREPIDGSHKRAKGEKNCSIEMAQQQIWGKKDLGIVTEL